MKFERIGNIAEFINGAAFKPEDWGNEGKKIIRIQNLTDPNKPYNYTKREVANKYTITKGDVLVSWSATIDVFIWDDEDALLNQHIFKVVFDYSKVEKNYFILALKSTIDELSKFAHGSTMKHVVKGDFENHKIPLPAIPTQIHIANILTKAETLIQQRKQSIALLDEFLKSTFLEMFINNTEKKDWLFTEIKNVVEKNKNAIKAGPFGSSLKKEFYVESGYKIYGQEQVIKDDLKFGNYYINAELYKKLESCKVKEGDILISLVGTYGKISVVPKDFEEGIINPRLMKISFDKTTINTTFFKHLFRSVYMLQQLAKLSRGGTMDIINVGIIKEIKIPVPPIELQNQFAHIVEKTETLKKQYQQSLQQLQQLFGSLSQQAFKGQLC